MKFLEVSSMYNEEGSQGSLSTHNDTSSSLPRSSIILYPTGELISSMCLGAWKLFYSPSNSANSPGIDKSTIFLISITTLLIEIIVYSIVLLKTFCVQGMGNLKAFTTKHSVTWKLIRIKYYYKCPMFIY